MIANSTRIALIVSIVTILGLGAVNCAQGAMIVKMTTTDGLVPGTAISYIITSNAPGGPRDVFTGASSDNGNWTWLGGFPEFLSYGAPQTMTVTFSAAVPLSDIVIGVNSISNSITQLTLGGGTGIFADINLVDGLAAINAGGLASYDPTNGFITAAGANKALMLGSTSDHTVTSLTLSAGFSQHTPGFGDGYTLFVGFKEVPEPASLAVVAIGIAGMMSNRKRMADGKRSQVQLRIR